MTYLKNLLADKHTWYIAGIFVTAGLTAIQPILPPTLGAIIGLILAILAVNNKQTTVAGLKAQLASYTALSD